MWQYSTSSIPGFQGVKWEGDPPFYRLCLLGEEARMVDHLTPKEIQAFIDGGLDRESRKRIQEHLDHCPVCVKWVADGVKERKGEGKVH